VAAMHTVSLSPLCIFAFCIRTSSACVFFFTFLDFTSFASLLFPVVILVITIIIIIAIVNMVDKLPTFTEVTFSPFAETRESS
jgi:hypothetical protein